jgi:hypothetical protein
MCPKTEGRAKNVKQRDEPEIDGFLLVQNAQLAHFKGQSTFGRRLLNRGVCVEDARRPEPPRFPSGTSSARSLLQLSCPMPMHSCETPPPGGHHHEAAFPRQSKNSATTASTLLADRQLIASALPRQVGR